MSNKSAKTIELDKENFIFEMEVERNQLNWFDALFTASLKAMKQGHSYQAQTLAEIGQYLSQDLGYYKDIQLERLNEK